MIPSSVRQLVLLPPLHDIPKSSNLPKLQALGFGGFSVWGAFFGIGFTDIARRKGESNGKLHDGNWALNPKP